MIFMQGPVFPLILCIRPSSCMQYLISQIKDVLKKEPASWSYTAGACRAIYPLGKESWHSKNHDNFLLPLSLAIKIRTNTLFLYMRLIIAPILLVFMLAFDAMGQDT